MYDVIIIGKGPAGISASLYLKMANLKVLVIGKEAGALEKARKIENYYGISGSGREILEAGEEQAKELGIEIVKEEVVNIDYNNKFIVTTTNKQYETRTVILATGANRPLPNIKGIKEFENKGISYCAVCDAFFYRGKNVAVLGNGEYAVHEAQYLKNVAKTVTILTNGKRSKFKQTEDIKILEGKIEEIIGENTVKAVKLENMQIEIEGLFIAEGIASSVDLAKKIGAQIQNNRIIVDENMQTSIKGLYAAGDCTGGLLQISKAVYEGSKAAIEIIKFLKNKNL